MKAGISRTDLIICDSAEPKSIQELHNLGLNTKPCKKGKDSIVNGIDILKRYKLRATARSRGVIQEQKRYKWAVDKNGDSLNKPIDNYNHAWDGIRYAAMKVLAVKGGGVDIR